MNKIEKIKAEIDRLQETTMDENSNFKSQYDQGIFDGLSIIDNFIDSLEQPIKRTPADIEAAMQEVEEKSRLFTEAHKEDVVLNDTLSNPLEISRHGNSHIEETLEEAARKIATRHSHITGDTYYANDAWFFKKGAQWQKQQDQSTIELAEDHAYLAGQEKMIAKACEWLKSYRQDTPDGTGYISGIVNDKTIEDFKKAMEE